jgi:hypothetical protein
MKRTLVCFCEHSFETDLPESVDLGADPAVETSILEGEFMSVRCPSCGKLLKPEFPVEVREAGTGRTLCLIPELDRSAYFRGTLPYKLAAADRVVIGYEELAEKIRIRRNDFDDQVIELIKYYLLNKILESYEGEREVRVLFSRLAEDTLVFHAVGLKDEEVGVMKVPRSMVDKVTAQLEERRKQEPYATILRGPYVSVNTLYQEESE